MSRATELGEILSRLGPQGLAWPARRGSNLRAILEGLAESFGRVELAVENLLEERDPRTAAELLPDWERLLGLPTDCGDGGAGTIVERRVAILARLTAPNGSTPAEIASILTRLVGAAELIEFSPFVAGSSAGDALTNGDWLYTFEVRAPFAAGQFFRVGTSGVGDRLFSSTAQSLECSARELAPAHVVVIVSFDLPGATDYQPWNPAQLRPVLASAVPDPLPFTVES